MSSAGVGVLAALGDPTRQAVYRLVLRSREPIGRDEAALELDISRPTAAFHLDKLAELGLVTVEFRRRSGGGGPGAGRPAKFYRAAIGEVSASVPDRRYDLAAEVAFDALGSLDPVEADRAVIDAATQRGRALAAQAGGLDEALTTAGYEPSDAGAVIQFSNCPFKRLMSEGRPAVCVANHALVRGLLEGLGENPDRAEFVRSGECCVQVAAG